MQQDAEHDVVIVGSGVAGALIADRLAAAGIRVVIMEAGPPVDRKEGVRRLHGGFYPYVSPTWAPQPTTKNLDWYYVQTGEVKFSSDYERRVGGTTWHWLGNCPRLLPSDFEMKTRYGVGVDWPISYDEIEPWYHQAEVELGVAGDSEEEGGSPRSGPFPMPPQPLSSGDLLFKKAAKDLGYDLLHTPQARNSVDGYQGRSICCGNGTCIPICPVQAKYDATVHLKRAQDNGAQIIDNAVVHRIEVDADSKITGVIYRTPDLKDHTITGRYYVVAAHGIETPKILLMSTGEYSPNGVANSSDQVGRNLSDHPEIGTSAILPKAYAGSRGPLQLSGIDSTREGDFRNTRAAIRFQVQHSVGGPVRLAENLISQGLHGKDLIARIQNTAPYQVRVASMTEQLPDPNNRVLPSSEVDDLGIPRPHLIYSHDDYTMGGVEVALQLHHKILDRLGATDVVDGDAPGGVGHVMSTYRMGDDPTNSVTDGDGRTFDHHNLFLAGSGLFPTTGTANPTLTIAALALRTAQALGHEFGATIPAATPVAATPAGD